MSHKDPDVVTQVIKEIESYWSGLTVYRGKKLIFLGIDSELNEDKPVTTSSPEYIDEAIEAFSEDINGNVSSPATKKTI